jgi:hypothetical protein
MGALNLCGFINATVFNSSAAAYNRTAVLAGGAQRAFNRTFMQAVLPQAVAVGESVITPPLNVLKDTYDHSNYDRMYVFTVIVEHVQMHIST